MDEPIVSRRSFEIAAIALLRLVLPPLVVVGMLYSLAKVYHEYFSVYFVAASAVAFALSALFLQPPRNLAAQMFSNRLPLILAIVTRWTVIFAVMLALAYVARWSGNFARRVVLTWAVTTPAVLVMVNLILNELRRRILKDPSNARRVVFAGLNEMSLSLSDRLDKNPEACMRVAGFFDDRSGERLGVGRSARLLGSLRDLASYVRTHSISVIFIALPVRHIQRVATLVDELCDTTASIYYVPDLLAFDLMQARTGELLGVPVVAMYETPFSGHRAAVKRLTDILIAATVLLTMLPVLIVIAVGIKASSPGPVLFRQRRYGLDGREIHVLKFRTMRVIEDGTHIRQATRNDARITRFGAFLRRYSLDEIPQLWNILQGSMSLVGPRPHAVAHNEQYRKLIRGYMLRHKVLPGLTGLAQINGCRGETVRLEDMEARVKFDLDYVRRWSLLLDFKIIMLTLGRIVRDSKAF